MPANRAVMRFRQPVEAQICVEMAPPTMTMAAAMINALVMTMAIASFIGSPRACGGLKAFPNFRNGRMRARVRRHG
jgi:hypothetical protein